MLYYPAHFEWIVFAKLSSLQDGWLDGWSKLGVCLILGWLVGSKYDFKCDAKIPETKSSFLLVVPTVSLFEIKGECTRCRVYKSVAFHLLFNWFIVQIRHIHSHTNIARLWFQESTERCLVAAALKLCFTFKISRTEILQTGSLLSRSREFWRHLLRFPRSL